MVTTVDVSQRIRELNDLHAQLEKKSGYDEQLMAEVKKVLREVQYVHKPQPIEIAFGLAVKDSAYVNSYRKYWYLNLEKFHATRAGKLTEAANYERAANEMIEAAMARLLKDLFNHPGPFYLFEGRVLYHELHPELESLM